MSPRPLPRFVASFAAIVALALAACAHEPQRAPVSVASTTSALTVTRAAGPKVVLPSVQGIERVAMGRCERFATCSTLTSYALEDERKECTRETKRELRLSLREHDCPAGIDRDRLEDCLTAIRSIQCDFDLKRVQAIAECRIDTLCQ